ncbi:hypothetical protein GCM10010517_15970 [Streptosporangium fragile]|uniref:MobA/VirD2-like nuclease domain-containing protein n=1 Tax=Streptosporangium fragile TaxID=46186 RepID=A0ABP6IB13_9ACTN
MAVGIEPAGGWVWHCALSLAPGEHLTDAAWAEVARAAVTRLGFDGTDGRAPCRWIAVHHGPSTGGCEHIHLAVNLVSADCRLARPGRDRIAMSRLCGELENRFGLRVIEGRARRGLPGLSRAEIERTRRARAAGPGPGRTAEPDRIVLARHVRAAAMAASTEAEFVRRAKAAGVWARPRYAAGGREEVVGYCVALPPEQGRTAIWFGGGKRHGRPPDDDRWVGAPERTGCTRRPGQRRGPGPDRPAAADPGRDRGDGSPHPRAAPGGQPCRRPQEIVTVRRELALRGLLPADVAAAETTRRTTPSPAPAVGRSPERRPHRTPPHRPDPGRSRG